ncbi:unnamed protein product [Plutella xylostella]|uniref:(diamondback moth) hypothetical protein n=1 Tax=Plutella xylostella TaxID=51655 RepID=A0A8S4DHD2_PLUXY|nr:unnamed protein product [Plutella xylostella]
MNNSDQPKKKQKKLKNKLQPNTNKGPRVDTSNDHGVREPPLCPLAAKDSEWVGVCKIPRPRQPSTSLHGAEERELHIVKREDVPAIKPVNLLFPGLLEKDPETVKGIYTKLMSTTDVTKRLVDLGQKANFTFMNKTARLIPRDKKWLECVTENTNSLDSSTTTMHNHDNKKTSDYDADAEGTDEEEKPPAPKKKIKKKRSVNTPDCDSYSTVCPTAGENLKDKSDSDSNKADKSQSKKDEKKK